MHYAFAPATWFCLREKPPQRSWSRDLKNHRGRTPATKDLSLVGHIDHIGGSKVGGSPDFLEHHQQQGCQPKKNGTPKMDGLYIMEKPIKMGWFGGFSHYFWRDTHKSVRIWGTFQKGRKSLLQLKPNHVACQIWTVSVTRRRHPKENVEGTSQKIPSKNMQQSNLHTSGWIITMCSLLSLLSCSHVGTSH